MRLMVLTERPTVASWCTLNNREKCMSWTVSKCPLSVSECGLSECYGNNKNTLKNISVCFVH